MTTSVRIARIWHGQTCVVIGGGPSLSLGQIDHIARARLDGKTRVVAVNNAVYAAWWSDWLHAGDYKWWREHIQRVQNFQGIRTTIDVTVPDAWNVWCLSSTGKTGFDPNPANCRTGGNSVYQAIHCLIHAGVKKIVLVGVDMEQDGERSHWHAGHGEASVDYGSVMVPHFATLLPVLEERSIQVVNASPGTALKTFPMVSLEQVLS